MEKNVFYFIAQHKLFPKLAETFEQEHYTKAQARKILELDNKYWKGFKCFKIKKFEIQTKQGY